MRPRRYATRPTAQPELTYLAARPLGTAPLRSEYQTRRLAVRPRCLSNPRLILSGGDLALVRLYQPGLSQLVSKLLDLIYEIDSATRREH